MLHGVGLGRLVCAVWHGVGKEQGSTSEKPSVRSVMLKFVHTVRSHAHLCIQPLPVCTGTTEAGESKGEMQANFAKLNLIYN